MLVDHNHLSTRFNPPDLPCSGSAVSSSGHNTPIAGSLSCTNYCDDPTHSLMRPLSSFWIFRRVTSRSGSVTHPSPDSYTASTTELVSSPQDGCSLPSPHIVQAHSSTASESRDNEDAAVSTDLLNPLSQFFGEVVAADRVSSTTSFASQYPQPPPDEYSELQSTQTTPSVTVKDTTGTVLETAPAHAELFVHRTPPAQPQTPVVIPTSSTFSALSVAETIYAPVDNTIAPTADPPTLPLPSIDQVMPARHSRPLSISNLSGTGNCSLSGKNQEPIARPSHSTGNEYPPAVAQPTVWSSQSAQLDVNSSARNYCSHCSARCQYADSGWIEYTLPCNTWYFRKPDSRVTTDLDLRNQTWLEDVETTVKSVLESIVQRGVPEGCEMWVRRSHRRVGWSKKKKIEAMGGLAVIWVDHRYRRVSNELPTEDGAVSREDDRLDDQYRYWFYVEMHPAHVALSREHVQEAVDSLQCWSRIGRLLTLSHVTPISQGECQELLGLLNDSNQQSDPSYTRVVAGVHLRLIHWHQVCFRPHKPLPHDIIVHVRRQAPILRTVVEELINVMCLDARFSLDRVKNNRYFDVKGRARTRRVLPFAVGVCTCLVSVILVGISTARLSISGLSGTPGTGCFIILCSVLSTIPSFLFTIWYKSDGLGPAAVHVTTVARE